MKVIAITKTQADEFVSKKHYSRRPSIFWNGYGLVDHKGFLCGVCVYGQPSPPIQKHAFLDRDFRLYELSRLVIQKSENLSYWENHNAASFLIGRSLSLLPKPCAVISYSDTAWNHAGIVYQATNWLYTGETISHDHLYLVNGIRTHPMTLRDQGIKNPKTWAKENNVETIKPMPKHRYFFLCGSRTQKKNMRRKLAYEVLPAYPKMEKQMYDAGENLTMKGNNQ